MKPFERFENFGAHTFCCLFLSVVLSASVWGQAPPGEGNPGAKPPGAQAGAAAPFEFLDGDRVVLLGDALIEREQSYGYVEARLTVRHPDRNVYFRNLGWSADTVLGQSRVSFDWNKGEDEWFKRLKGQIAAVQPTVAILGYGMASSFEGEAGLPKFRSDMEKLMDAIQEISKERGVRFILLSPIRHENLGAPLPDPTVHNRQLALYTEAIRDLALKRNARFINLFELLGDGMAAQPPRPLTDNGIHLNARGYWRLGEVIELGLGWRPVSWQLGILPPGRVRDGSHLMEASEIEWKEDGVRFKGQAAHLEYPPIPGDDGRIATKTPPNLLQFVRMRAGNYTLKVDGQTVMERSSRAWQNAVQITDGTPSFDQAEQLRQAILKKNELYFHRWRPQNETYLFGFRKHEQGRNAREIPMFDPLVSEQEEKIALLRKPVKRVYELVRTGEDSAALTPDPVKRKRGGTVSAPSVPAARAASAQPIPGFTVAEGFEVELFAENPDLAKPIQMNFDPQGRLWVASSSVYPQIEPGQTAADTILVLEDVNGDGKADKSTVFAEGLLIPTGIEPGDGGAYVGQSTELLHFKDVDGDGKADERRVVLSGFGTEDTHHILHTLRWGHDGQLYFNQSIYIHSHIETPHGVVRLNSGGILHLRPPTLELGVFLKGFVNTWGHDFDEYGQSFATDGAGGQGINYGVPGAMYVTYAGARKILGSVSPGNYPKFCGLETIYSEHFPKDWQGNFVTCDFRAHRVVRFSISEQGSAYVTTQMPDLLRSTNVTFRPIDVKLGPDGALYIADWSNPIIQHGEVDFRDPRRDHEHGRIWRVKAKGRSLLEKPSLARAANEQLLEHLKSPNAFTRKNARRVLTERGKSILPQLTQWTSRQETERGLLEALWMHQSIDQVEPELLGRLLSAQDGRVRAAATRVARFWHSRLPNGAELLAGRIGDEHPRVRLEAMRALSHAPTARSAELVLGVLEKPMDPFLNYGLWLTINDLAKPWIEALRTGAWPVEGRERQLEFGLESIEPSLASEVLGQLEQARTISRNGAGPWIELIGKAGSPRELRRLFDQVLSAHFEPEAAGRALGALGQAARLRKAVPGGDLSAVKPLLEHRDEGVRMAALRLAGSWKQDALAPLILTQAESASPEVRAAAFESLREIGGAEGFSRLEGLAGKGKSLAVRKGAVQVLAALDAARAAPLVVDVLREMESEADALSFWRALLSNRGASAALTRALPAGELPSAIARAGMRVARESGRNEPALILALARSGSLEEEARDLTPAEVQQMVASIQQQGDAARGEGVYRRNELACVACHAIGGVGGKVGPDMTSIGASAPADYLIESLLFPNRKVKEGYHAIMLETKDGQDLSGILVRETGEQVIVRDAANREVAVAKNNIQSRTIGGSLMPSGLLEALNNVEQLDLFRFLTELGKPGPYDASKGNVARFWKLMPATIDLAQFGDDRALKGNLDGREWAAVFSYVDGRLPKVKLEAVLKTVASRDPSALYAAARFEVAKAGKVRLNLSDAPRMGAWVNGTPVAGSGWVAMDLEAGTHTFVMKLDPRKLPEHVRLETSDGTFLTN